MAIQKVVEQQAEALQSRFPQREEPLQIIAVFLAPTVESMGDALRDFDSRVNLAKDFLLMSATSFVVADIRRAVAAHRERNESRRSSCDRHGREQILTQIYSSHPPTSPQRLLSDDVAFVLDGETKEIVKQTSLRSRASVGLGDVTLVEQGPASSASESFEVRYDLVDSGVSICTPTVLEMFRYSFDFMCMSRDFIPAVVSREIKLHSVFAHVLQPHRGCSAYTPFAARVSDPRSFFSLSQSVIERWSNPVVPDSVSLFLHQARLRYKGSGTYQADSVVVGKRSEVGPLSVVEAGTQVGDDATVRSSCVGAGCRIGRGAVVEGAVLLGNVQVDEGAVVRDALLFPFAHVKRSAEVQRGSLLGSHVTVGEACVVPPHMRLHVPLQASPSAERFSAGDAEAGAERQSVGIVGSDGRGCAFLLEKWRSERTKRVDHSRLAHIAPGGSIAPAIALRMPRFARNPQEEEDDAAEEDFQFRSCPSFRRVLTGLSAADVPSVTVYNEGLDDELLSLCEKYMQSSSFGEQNDLLRSIEAFLSSRKLRGKTNSPMYPARHALRAFLFQLASLGPVNKEGWKQFIEAHRVESLLISVFPLGRLTPPDYFPLWSSCLKFCETALLARAPPAAAGRGSVEAGQTQARSKADANVQTPNPLHGPSALCSLLETMHACDLLDCQATLPYWFTLMRNRGKRGKGTTLESGTSDGGAGKAKVNQETLAVTEEDEMYLRNPRLVAFCEWLRLEQMESDDEYVEPRTKEAN
ncbi:putative eukaryotic initiation factor-2B, epsilon subunit [Besnoitia besnoiti]|uniref:Putative eukaryotic initiation factor-2B, epsilon subunit n=1 Tax=Besnoitia besnoiti TaxID=94643 RepID=A0A2A9M1E4_BESBE|nr:putative eukaryotic initiation factor-2B, epsilon subunit [Besnoitia besnoiti]PFH31064.1 putative eukaryotic initiation factor-2B, epsilon subunit [Besnoitia besnoiti]